ncbi:hypothetical protein [Mesorhizobium denitrificans]|uniref:Uncharacterized protein n=1 Tax=Mesorhizobium denitrificans TaxID=2294114 RepID=A0A371XF47_9HYPH|nr:hypothetical protein [Mesorhizobium denitrificans]RFC67846.1 hypothetical protein DY251_09695 [Mesorhizobium denitrificans]
MSKISDELEGCANYDELIGRLSALAQLNYDREASECAAIMLIKRCVQAGGHINDDLRLSDAAKEAARYLRGRH